MMCKSASTILREEALSSAIGRLNEMNDELEALIAHNDRLLSYLKQTPKSRPEIRSFYGDEHVPR